MKRANGTHFRDSVPIEYTRSGTQVRETFATKSGHRHTIRKLDRRGSWINTCENAAVSNIRMRDERYRFSVHVVSDSVNGRKKRREGIPNETKSHGRQETRKGRKENLNELMPPLATLPMMRAGYSISASN